MTAPVNIYNSIFTNSAGESLPVGITGSPPPKILKELLANENDLLQTFFKGQVPDAPPIGGTRKYSGWENRMSALKPMPWLKAEYVDKIGGYVPLFNYDGNKLTFVGNLEEVSINKKYSKKQIIFNNAEQTIQALFDPYGGSPLFGKSLSDNDKKLFGLKTKSSLKGWQTQVGMTASEKASLAVDQDEDPNLPDSFKIDPVDLQSQIETQKKFGTIEEYKARQKEYLIDYFSGADNSIGKPLNFAIVDLDLKFDEETGQLTGIDIVDAKTGMQIQPLTEEQLAITKQELQTSVLQDFTLEGLTKEEAIEAGLDSEDWNKAGSKVFDENGDPVGTTFEAADGSIRFLPDSEVDASLRSAISRQKYGQSKLGGTTTKMGAEGISPSLTTADPYRTIPTGQYAQSLQTQLPGAELPTIQSLYQQNLPAFQESYDIAQLLGMVAVDPDATMGQTGTIGFQKFLQTNPDIKSIYSQGLNAIENVKDQVRAGRLPGTLSAEDQMIYDRYIAGSEKDPMFGHKNELMLRQRLTDYLPEAMRYSAKMALQRRYDAALTGDPNALATSNIYGTSGNPWAGGTTAAMPVFGGGLSFGTGTPMGAESFTGTTKALPPTTPTAKVGPTGTNEYNPPGSTGTRFNPATGMMEVFDLNTGGIVSTYYIKTEPDILLSGGIQAGKTEKFQYPQKPKPALKPPTSSVKALIDKHGGPPQLPPHIWAGQGTTLLSEEQEELEKARKAEMLYGTY